MIVMTLVCAYAACWGPTKHWGTHDINTTMPWFDEEEPLYDSHAVVPLIVAATEYRPPRPDVRCYYFWFFGYVVKLPYERKLEPPEFMTPQRVHGGVI